MQTEDKILAGRFVALAVIVGSVAFCKYQERAMIRNMISIETKIAQDKISLRESLKNLYKN